MPVREPGAGTLAKGLARSPTPPAIRGGCGGWEACGQKGREGPQSSRTLRQQMLPGRGVWGTATLRGSRMQ